MVGEEERKTEKAAEAVGKDLAELVLKGVSKHVSNKDIKEKLNAEEVSTLQLLEDVAKLAVDAAKLIFKDKEGIKVTAKLILKAALKKAAVIIVKEAVELVVKEQAKLLLNKIEMKIDHPHTSSKESIGYWIEKHTHHLEL